MPLKAAIVPVTPFMQNCTLLWDDQSMSGAVVDPGGDVARIEAGIKKAGMSVEKIILTHGHIDHAGGALELKEKLGGIPIEGPHQADGFLLENLEQQGAQFGIGGVRNVTPDRWLDEGDTVSIAGHTFSVLHCPGHSPGSVVLVYEPQRFILMGDVLFKGSIGRTDFPYGDHDALIGAIKTKLLPLGDEYSFICGHGPMSTIGEERRSNQFLA
jgi:hydroxyacylglutathione hydrolase